MKVDEIKDSSWTDEDLGQVILKQTSFLNRGDGSFEFRVPTLHF
jgi:hypothetical protein